MLRKLCGDSALKNVILVTNMWGKVPLNVGEAREQDLVREFFKPALDKGAQLARHHNTTQSAHDFIRHIMKNNPVPLQIQRELVDEHRELFDTAAAQAVNDELNELIRRHQTELKTIRDEMLQALKNDDKETRQELQEESHKVREGVNKMRTYLEGTGASYNEEKWMMGEAVRQIQEQVRQETERVEVEYRRQMDDLNGHLQRGTSLVSLLGGQHRGQRTPNGPQPWCVTNVSGRSPGILII